MKIDVQRAVQALSQETLAIRRDVHAHPELGFREFRTAELIETRLRALGLRVRRCAGTGVIGVLEGGLPGKTVMLRSDMDALPITEENDLPFCSQNPGVMHACGHDCHVAIQLQTAKILSSVRDQLPGRVLFLFQPNEEDAGAAKMIEDGALTDPRPDAVFCMHVWSPIPLGKVGMVSGPDCASSYYFKVTIRGKDTHGCLPERGVSPITAGYHLLGAIDSMQTMEYSTLDEPTLITVGSLHAGNYMNNIPEELVMEGSIRCLHPREKEVHARFTALVKQISAAFRCTAEVTLTCGNSMLVNDPALYELATATVAPVVGESNILSQGIREMGGDDLAEFLLEGIPGLYYLVGMGNAQKGSDAPHHNKNFRVDEDVLDLGVLLQSRIALAYLGALDEE